MVRALYGGVNDIATIKESEDCDDFLRVVGKRCTTFYVLHVSNALAGILVRSKKRFCNFCSSGGGSRQRIALLGNYHRSPPTKIDFLMVNLSDIRDTSGVLRMKEASRCTLCGGRAHMEASPFSHSGKGVTTQRTNMHAGSNIR